MRARFATLALLPLVLAACGTPPVEPATSPPPAVTELPSPPAPTVTTPPSAEPGQPSATTSPAASMIVARSCPLDGTGGGGIVCDEDLQAVKVAVAEVGFPIVRITLVDGTICTGALLTAGCPAGVQGGTTRIGAAIVEFSGTSSQAFVDLGPKGPTVHVITPGNGIVASITVDGGPAPGINTSATVLLTVDQAGQTVTQRSVVSRGNPAHIALAPGAYHVSATYGDASCSDATVQVVAGSFLTVRLGCSIR